MSKSQKNIHSHNNIHTGDIQPAYRQPPRVTLSSEFVTEALANHLHLIRFHLMANLYPHGARSLHDIARALYHGPRCGKPLPTNVDPLLVRMVEGKLDTKRLSVANLVVEGLFTRHFGMGRLLGGEGEGLGFDHLTRDGCRAAGIIAHLLFHWIYLAERLGGMPQGRRTVETSGPE